MDELPDLRSDQDVDALMARLRARIAPPQTPAPAPGSALSSASSPAWDEFVTAQREAAATMVRALSVLADAFDELSTEARDVGETSRSTARRRPAARQRLRSRRTRR